MYFPIIAEFGTFWILLQLSRAPSKDRNFMFESVYFIIPKTELKIHK